MVHRPRQDHGELCRCSRCVGISGICPPVHSREIDLEKFTRIAFKCGECFFGHKNGGRIYLNGVSRTREIRQRSLDVLQGENVRPR